MLELKEKIGVDDAGADRRRPVRRTSSRATRWSSSATRLLEAEQALAAIDPELPAEERVRLALRQAA